MSANPRNTKTNKVTNKEEIETLDLTNSDDERPASPPIAVYIDETNVQVLDNKQLLLTCQTCGTCFTQLPLFIEHIIDHEVRKRQNHICTICQSEFISVERLQRHNLKHSKDIFICKTCFSCFTSSISRDKHQLTHGPNKNIFNCKKCRETFTSQNGFARHFRLFECDLCGMSYTALTSLKRHLVFKHDVIGDFNCNVCLQKFGRSAALRMHLDSNPKCGKPHACTICDHRTSLKTTLQKHMYSHSDERPFTCEICDKRFKKLEYVTRHLFSHLSEKPFRCDLCPKQFGRADHLKSHKNRHSKMLFIRCRECTAIFHKHGKRYKSHQALHKSGKELATCDLCGYQMPKPRISRHIKRCTRSQRFTSNS